MQCAGGQGGDVHHVPLATANAAADQVPAGAPSLSPRKGSAELVEGREHCAPFGKAQAEVFNPADICKGEQCSSPGRLSRKLREEKRTQSAQLTGTAKNWVNVLRTEQK